MNRRSLWIVGIVLVLVAGAAGATYYLLGPSSTHQPAPGGGPAGPTQTPSGVVHTGTGCGVKQNTDGTYTFSWLHVAEGGQIVDETNCKVQLVGFNMGGLFLGDGGTNASLSKYQWYKRTFPMNVARLNFNSRWWADDVNVPLAHMRYRQWLQTVVKWQEQAGNYVMLDKGPHFAEPPCDRVTITLCPSQDQGKKDYAANPNPETAKGLETYIGYDIQAWTDLSKLYANDPAILYDAWNEPTLSDLPVFYQDMNTMINTIREGNPKALVIVYQRGYRDIVNGKYPNYTQPNLVIDAHIYPKFNGTSPATGKACHSPGKDNWTPQNSSLDMLTQFAHSHNQAFIVNEWGGCYDEPGYHQQLTSYAKAQGIGLAYFQAGDVVDNPNATSPQINDNGRQVQTAYADILGVAVPQR